MVMMRKPWLVICVCISILISSRELSALSSLARNDAYPVFSSLDPQDFLLTAEKLRIREPDFAKKKNSNASISISPFGQNAERGRNLDKIRSELGDLQGRWGMIPLLYGPIPPGQTLAPTLQTALTNLFPGVVPGTLSDASKIDPSQDFGYFSVPLKYKKRGVRVELEAMMVGGFGLKIETGVVSMTQTNTGFIDLTTCTPMDCHFNPSPLTGADVIQYLMLPLDQIADEIKLNLCDFSEISIEEVRLILFWRKIFELNAEDDNDYPHLMFIPFFELGGSVSPGAIKDPNKQLFNEAFAVPFGNNGHSAVGFTGGLNFDFVESIEIGSEVGITYFFKENFDNYRVPTSEYQSGIFPYRTSVSVTPGLNWHFGAKISAYHFLDKLSGYFQYIQMEHKPDSINLRKCEDEGIFLPEVLECRSSFQARMANIALNYDISPNMGLGIFAQLPLDQKNAYRSTTVMLSFNASF